MYEIQVPKEGKGNGWCAAEALHVHDGLYRLIGSVPKGQHWRFTPGDVVECESRTLDSGKQVLEARRVVTHEHEPEDH